MPMGLVFVMVFIFDSNLEFISTFSMAPLIALMPQETPLPSKAGPAEAEQHAIHSLLPKTISPFVPISIRSVRRSSLFIPHATVPATISPPT